MTSYHGGKQKIGKKIASVICSYIEEVSDDFRGDIKGYCEPFCGMLGVYQHVFDCLSYKEDSLYQKNIKFLAGDYNESLIMMWKKAQKGWLPPTHCSEEKYEKIKRSKIPSAEKGFIGHQYSYGGQYFKGYRGKYKNKDKYVKAAHNVKDIATSLKKVKFSHGPYTQFSKLKGYIIYCDPPYYGSDSYYFDENHKRLSFDHLKFWKWCLKMSENNIVFISEYNIPIKEIAKSNDMTISQVRSKIKKIFDKKVNLTGSTPNKRSRTEKLFVIV